MQLTPDSAVGYSMPILVKDSGRGNAANLHSAGKLKGGMTFNGDGSLCDIGQPFASGTVSIVMGSNCILKIGKQAIFDALIIRMGSGCTLEIGDNLGVNGKLTIHMFEPSAVSIGKQCLFGGNVSLATSDAHALFDIETGERFNYAKDICIGRRVWVGADATLLKGTEIGDFSMIGTHSVTSGKFPEFCVAAGNPAKIIRTGVSWCRRIQDYAPEDVMREIAELRGHRGMNAIAGMALDD